MNTYFESMVEKTFMHSVVCIMEGRIKSINKYKILLVAIHIIIHITKLHTFAVRLVSLSIYLYNWPPGSPSLFIIGWWSYNPGA